MKALIACEESQTSCKILREMGIEAYSCDIKPCSGGQPQWHIIGDAVKEAYSGKYDFMLAHPPCTYLTSAAGHLAHNPDRIEKGKQAATFFMQLFNAPIKYICVENPRPLRQYNLPKPTCTVTPNKFGDKYTKRTYLWCKNLPPIIFTCENPDTKSFVFSTRGSTNRSKSNEIMYKEILKQFIDFIKYDNQCRAPNVRD